MADSPLQTELLAVNDEQHASTADKFYRDLDSRHLTFKFNPSELEDLQSAVTECILQILERVVNIDDRYISKELIRVGSFTEGTKILAPDEFDYLVVIEELSKPGVVSAVRCGEEIPGYMTLQVTDEKTHERWKDYYEDGYLLGFVLNSPKKRLNKSSKAMGISSMIQQVYMESCNDNPILISKPSGTLKYAGVQIVWEPSTMVYMLWSNKSRDSMFQITVDISPAVRCYNVKQALHPDNCRYTNFNTKIQEHGSYLLTPGKGNKSKPTKYFRISLTEVEVSIVKSFDSTHRTCYRVLKYILANLCCKLTFTDVMYSGFSSYVLKSAVLHHVADGQCQSSDIQTCVESVVSSLINCLVSDKQHTKPFMSSVFIEGHNLFQQLMHYQQVKSITHELIMHVQSLTNYLSFTRKLCTISKDNYDYAGTIEMLENCLLDLIKAHISAKTITEMYLDADGNWDITGISITELLSQCGVSYKTLQEVQRPDVSPR